MSLNNIKEILEKIRENNDGTLSPSKVVEEARPVSSPLHSKFEWNDGHAADQYRLEQARRLIRIIVTTVKHDKKDYEVRTYVSLTSDRTGEEKDGYRLITDVLKNDETRAVMIKDALAELRIFRIKYSQLKELAEIFKAIDAVQTKE